LIGTTNEDEFLDDPTGERRHLPLQTSGFSDPDGLRAARDQLWAEALVLFNKGGVAWEDAQRLAPAEIAKVKVSDLWEEHFERWLADSDEENGPARSEGRISVSAVLSGAVYLPVKDQNRSQQMRAAKILKGMGYQKWSNGAHRYWTKT
jgi:predicted P-loop ATPase